MKNIIYSKQYKIFAASAVIYTVLTYLFTGDIECLLTDVSGFCGVISSILNAPAVLASFPLLFISDSSSTLSLGGLILYMLTIIMGWLIVGVVIAWLIQKIKSLNNPQDVTKTKNTSQSKILDRFVKIYAIFLALFLIFFYFYFL